MKEGVTGKIEINDVNPRILTKFLEFIYNDSILVYNDKDVIPLIELADKYDVLSLVAFLGEKAVSLSQSLDLVNICLGRNDAVFEKSMDIALSNINELHAGRLSDTILVKISFRFFEFLLSTREHLKGSEIEIFEAIARWSSLNLLSKTTIKEEVLELTSLVDYRRIWSGDIYTKVIPLQIVDPYIILEALSDRIRQNKSWFH